MVVGIAALSSVIAVGATVNIAGLSFVNTPAGLIQETPLTCRQLATLAGTEMPGGYTLADNPFGVMAMHQGTGHGYVLTRGPQDNPASWFMDPVPLEGETLTMGSSRDSQATLTRGITVPLMPASEIYADPERADFPASNITWYQGAAIAAAFTQLQHSHLIRMITEEEYDRAVLSDGQESQEEVIARAHLRREGATGLASVVGDTAERSTSRWGLKHIFGNVWTWTNGNLAVAGTGIRSGTSIGNVLRVSRSVSWSFVDLPNEPIAVRYFAGPASNRDGYGVRFVAVPRTPQ